MRGDFNDIIDEHTLDHVDLAREWLLNITDKFITDDNINKIKEYETNGYIIKKYSDVENHTGKPTHIIIDKNGKITVNMRLDIGINKITSLYEIELLSSPISSSIILTEHKLKHINQVINMINNNNVDSIKIDSNADISVRIDKKFNCTSSDKYNLKSIEIYKLERLLQLMRTNSTVKFSISTLPNIYHCDTLFVNNNDVTIPPTEAKNSFRLNEISIENKPKTTLKYINLDPHLRFVDTKVLRESYIQYPKTINPHANPYVTINNEFELGIVDTENNIPIAKAISSLLSRSINDAKAELGNGGYLPEKIVERAQLEYVSPYAISNLWGKSGYRFVLSRYTEDSNKREIIGTALISSSKDILFFFTCKYNNLKYSEMSQNVDFNMRFNDHHKWFDKFDMPYVKLSENGGPVIDQVKLYKPIGCNQLANFAIEKIGCRGFGLGKFMIDEFVKNYAVHYSESQIKHSQPLICGHGLFQIADPSWKSFMMNIGFKLRLGSETFYIDNDWDPLVPIVINGKKINNSTYNNMFDMPAIYNNIDLNNDKYIIDPDLIFRIPHVVKLSNSNKAKLQYFQLIYMFNNKKI